MLCYKGRDRRCDAVIGPLPKGQYMAAIASFTIPDAFPDIETKAFGYSIDPQARRPTCLLLHSRPYN